MERDKSINLFEDVRDDGYEYGWEDFPDTSVYEEKHVEIRRKIGSGIDDVWEFMWHGEWWDDDKLDEAYPDISDMPDELLSLAFAIGMNVEFELQVADGFRTHNSRQMLPDGRSMLDVLEGRGTPNETTQHGKASVKIIK